MVVILLLIGVALTVGGVALLNVPASIATAGVLLLLAGVDMTRADRG